MYKYIYIYININIITCMYLNYNQSWIEPDRHSNIPSGQWTAPDVCPEMDDHQCSCHLRLKM